MLNILAPAMARKPKIDIQLEGDTNEYTTGDRICGKVVIESNTETQFDTIEIKLVGRSKTFVDLMSALPGIQEISKSSQTFLTLRQPGLETLYPLDRTLKRGTTYELPFEFVLPKRLVDGSCGHQVASPSIREAHLALPPSFGRQDSVGKGGDVDSTVPETAIINYGISATISKSKKLNTNKKPTAMAATWREILVVPCTDAVLPADVRKAPRGGVPSDHCLRSVKKMSKGIIRSSLGTVTVEVAPPRRLRLKRREEEASSHRFCTVPVNVMLRFERNNRTTAAPQVSKITSRLEVNTFYATSSHQELPRRDDGVYDRNRRVYTKHMPSAAYTPENVNWAPVKAKCEGLYPEPAHVEIANCERNQTADSLTAREGSSSITDLLVPVTIPIPTTLVPTFHSCLISRTYVLEMSIKLTSQGCNRTAHLRLPVQISADTCDHYVDLAAGNRIAMDSMLPCYFDDCSTFEGQTHDVDIAGDVESGLSNRDLESLACVDSPPAYCVYL